MKALTAMMPRDKFEEIAWSASYAVAVVGNPASGGFELFDLGPAEQPSEARNRELLGLGFEFLGVIGIVRGRVRVALSEPVAPEMSSAISAAFCQHIENAITDAIKPGGTLDWVRRLVPPDTREN